MSGRFCWFRRGGGGLAVFCWGTCWRRCLPSALRTAFAPLGPEDLSWRKICLSAGSAPPCTTKQSAAVGRILIFGGLATIFAGSEFAGLLYYMRFASKSSGYASLKSGRPTSVHRCGMGPARGGLHLQKMLLNPPLSISHREDKFCLNWIAG